jgi:hypothetical protein
VYSPLCTLPCYLSHSFLRLSFPLACRTSFTSRFKIQDSRFKKVQDPINCRIGAWYCRKSLAGDHRIRVSVCRDYGKQSVLLFTQAHMDIALWTLELTP